MGIPRRRLPGLTELVAFESAARLGSFTRAAEEMNLTQGAVSRQIRSLEDTIGASLFVRVRRSVVLTDAGRLYLTDVRRILAEVADAGERVAAFGDERVVTLAVLPTFATRWLMPRMPRFIARHPGVTVNFLVRLEPFSFEAEPFDAAIHFGDGVWPGAQARFLCKERMVAVANPDLVERQGLRSPADIARATLLHQTTRPNAWSQWLAEQGIEVGGTLRGPRLEQFAMIAEAATAGLGVALVPEFLVEAELAAGRLVTVAAARGESRSAYWFVIPDRKLGEPLVCALRDWMVAETAPLNVAIAAGG